MACNAGVEHEPCLTIFWDVENYSDYVKERDRCISSPTFRVESIETSTWVFSLFPQGRRYEDYISYALKGSLSKETSEIIEVEFEVAILAEDGSALQIREREGYRSGSPKCLDEFALREEVTKTKREIFLSRDTLRTRCRLWRTSGEAKAPLTIFGRTALKEEQMNFIGEVSQLTSTSDLKDDFEHLYSEGILSDVTLRTASETFNAHKTILSARSPVFLAMFTTDMKESMQDYVDVSDLDNDIVRRMLLYMYTNNLEDLHWESAFKLYPAANKYQIVALKKKCAYFLKQNLSPSNVCDVLGLTDMHGDEDFKKAAQDYVLAHEKDVFSSDEWAEFAKSSSALAMDTMLRKWKGKTE
ncbi:TD and POZ domain-containing protein 3 [Trichonephila clavipes]|nr:TD and POZ domain-containing protein 3 [Trichonephila clavipes]